MRALIFLAMLAAAVPAGARQAKVLCTTKAYSCLQTPDGSFECGWRNTSDRFETRLTLIKNKNYPNPEHPYEVWQTVFSPFYDGHQLHLRITNKLSKDKNGKETSSLQLRARLDTPNVSAETSGNRSIDIALRNDNYGRGFYCPTIEILP